MGAKKLENGRGNTTDSSQYDSLISTASCSDDEAEPASTKVEEEEEAEIEEKKGKEEEEEEDEEADDVFNPYSFIAGLPHHDSVKVRGKVCLPATSAPSTLNPRTTLVLDLDETLVHCTVEPIPKPDLVFPVA